MTIHHTTRSNPILAGAASLSAATSVAVPSIAIAADTPVSFPGLVARLMPVRERWLRQRALDKGDQDRFDDLFFAASGMTGEQYRALDEDDARKPELRSIRRKISAEFQDTDPVDEEGASIAWREIWDELNPLAEALLEQPPKSLVDLAWQAEVLVMGDSELLNSDSGYLYRRLVGKFLENARACGGFSVQS
jgi:hypothetical protein